MKIGFDAKRAFNNHRGLGNYSRETLRILTTLAPDHQYHLFTPEVDPSIGFHCPDNAVVHQPSDRLGRLSPSMWRTFSISKEVEQLGLDLYHGLSHELPYGIEKTKTRTVVTMHDLLFLKKPELYPFVDRLMYRTKYLHSCQVAHRVIAVSERTKQDLLELTSVPESKVDVVYQGCRPEFKTLVGETQKKDVKQRYELPDSYLLNVGAIEPRKNQMLLLKALIAGHIDMPLVIAGQRGNSLQELRSFIVQQKLQHQVKVLPDFPYEDLPALYQCATLFVFPSIYEGFGIPIVEAMTSGLPVIAATGSCLEEAGGSHSRYVDPTDATAWAEAINEILNDESKRGTMIVKGLEHVQRFSDPAIADQLLRIYNHLLI